MAYVVPTERSTGALITASIWNQDVVENFKSIRALVDVEATVIAENGTSATSYSLTAAVWNTRRLNLTVRDPDGIIYGTNYPSYQFQLSDGTYLADIWSSFFISQQTGQWYSTRLRDVSNSATIFGTNYEYVNSDNSGAYLGTKFNYGYWEFTLANSGPTTLELQTYISSGTASVLWYEPLTYDAQNGAGVGVYHSYLKLWKIV